MGNAESVDGHNGISRKVGCCRDCVAGGNFRMRTDTYADDPQFVVVDTLKKRRVEVGA
jgi:hypothetical protein